MSYQVIARKWRPQTFEEVTGQETVTRTLRNAIEHDRLHHAYLFSGARGVGKTTTARILAKALNCHKFDRPTPTPCKWDASDICASCQEIAESRSIDVLEIDAASHTGIDDVRETIIENINFNPTRDRYRVFIIDEVHQLSKPAFNALLKTLEEPPPNVVFIMATTELHKVPDTILSRCQEFEFRTIPIQKIFDRLKLIADAEKIDIADDALRELARSGMGSMRDAQSNFDQVISFSGDKIGAADVTGALGFASVEVLSKVVTAIAEKDCKTILATVDELISGGHDLRNFCRDFLALFRDLLVFKIAGGETQLFEAAVFDADQMKAMASRFTEADLLRFFNSLAETEASLREAAHPRYVLEVGLIKLVEMRSVASLESIIERLGSLGSGGTLPKSSAAAAGDAPQEKKTLKSEKPVDARATLKREPIAEPVAEDLEPFYEEPPSDDIGFEPPVIEAIASETPLPHDWIASVSVRLAPIPSSELEHIEDRRLDEAYEAKLALTGDDLMPLKSMSEFVGAMFGPSTPKPISMSNGSAAAPVRTVDVSAIRPKLPDDEPVEIPILGTDPTEEELMNYANALPAVRAAKRVFRAKVIEVKKA
jgi:DNA polymerase-3 subunit gamma/tau